MRLPSNRISTSEFLQNPREYQRKCSKYDPIRLKASHLLSKTPKAKKTKNKTKFKTATKGNKGHKQTCVTRAKPHKINPKTKKTTTRKF